MRINAYTIEGQVPYNNHDSRPPSLVNATRLFFLGGSCIFASPFDRSLSFSSMLLSAGRAAELSTLSSTLTAGVKGGSLRFFGMVGVTARGRTVGVALELGIEYVRGTE